MKNVRIKVRYFTCTTLFDFGIYKDKKLLMENLIRRDGTFSWRRKSYVIRAAKAMAKRIGIPYSDEIIKQHGC